jgi:hypothetical protein
LKGGVGGAELTIQRMGQPPVRGFEELKGVKQQV